MCFLKMKEYSKYKPSGLDWLGPLPTHWSNIKLKHIANYFLSSINRHVDVEERSVDICHYPYAYKNESIDSQTELDKGSCTLDQFEKYKLIKGQIIITKDSESADDIGVPAYVQEDVKNAVCGYHLGTIQSNSDKIDSKYLFRFVQSTIVSNYFEMTVNGITRYGLSKPTVENLTIPFPPLQEQTQIAKYLDYQTNIIDQLIEKKEKLVILLQEQRQAIINEAVTKGLDPNAKMKDSGIEWLGEIPEKWTIAKTKHITINVTDGAHVSPDLSSDDFPFISTVNIGNRGQIDWANCLHTSSESYHSLVANGCRPKIGDVLYSKDGTIGKTTIIDFEREFVVASSLLIIRPNPDLIESEFLNYLFHSNFVNQQIDQLLSGVALRRISITKFSNLEMIIPPLNVQKKIVNAIKAKVNLLNSVLDLINDQIIKLKEYRQSIISEAVTGKIDLREWQAPKSAIA